MLQTLQTCSTSYTLPNTISFLFRLGYVGKTLLLQLNNHTFDPIRSLMPEYMHLTCLGQIRRLMKCTFKSPDNDYKGKFSLEVLDKLLSETKVPSEFQRKTRPVIFGAWKAEEYRNTILFYFPAVIQYVIVNYNRAKISYFTNSTLFHFFAFRTIVSDKEFQRKDERLVQIWSLLAYVVRACCMLPHERSRVPLVQEAADLAFELWNKYFRPETVSYNIHHIPHLPSYYTVAGPLPDWSAFRFESMYLVIRRNVSASRNLPQQLLNRCNEYHLREDKHKYDIC